MNFRLPFETTHVYLIYYNINPSTIQSTPNTVTIDKYSACKRTIKRYICKVAVERSPYPSGSKQFCVPNRWAARDFLRKGGARERADGLFLKKISRSKADFAPAWRSGWDSNPRYREVQLISSQSRYDHFDTAPKHYSFYQKIGTTSTKILGAAGESSCQRGENIL